MSALKVNRLITILIGLAFSVMGILMFCSPLATLSWFSTLVGGLFILSGLSKIGGFLFGKGEKNTMQLLMALVNLVFGSMMLWKSPILVITIQTIFSLWAIIAGLIKIVIGIQYRKDQEREWLAAILSGLALAVIGYLMLNSRALQMVALATIMGIYLLVYGITTLGEYYFMKDRERRERRGPRITFSLPLWIEAFFPQRLLKKIRKQLAGESAEELQKTYDYLKPDSQETAAAVEVCLHLSEDPLSSYGHMDLSIGDTVVSYGNYDLGSGRLFGILNDGVLALCKRKPYIRYCLEKEKKVLLAYQVRVTQEELERLGERLNELLTDLTPWDCLAERGEKDCQDPASLLHQDTDAQFYKFKKGKFKTFFFLNTNCAAVVYHILSSIDFPKITLWGAITPGACYRYFETQLRDPSSPVIGRRIYCLNDEEYSGHAAEEGQHA